MVLGKTFLGIMVFWKNCCSIYSINLFISTKNISTADSKFLTTVICKVYQLFVYLLKYLSFFKTVSTHTKQPQAVFHSLERQMLKCYLSIAVHHYLFTLHSLGIHIVTWVFGFASTYLSILTTYLQIDTQRDFFKQFSHFYFTSFY